MAGEKSHFKNPLAIIGLIVITIEGIFGTTAYKISPGCLQAFLIISMVLIFASVIAAFFYVLIKYPGHFYSPKEFPSGILPFSGKEKDIPRTDPRGGKKSRTPPI